MASLDPEEGASKLFATDGSYYELAFFKDRVVKGFKDIIHRKSAIKSRQVVVMVSHNKCMNPFLKACDYSGPDLKKVCYCAMAGVKVVPTDDGYKVDKIEILKC